MQSRVLVVLGAVVALVACDRSAPVGPANQSIDEVVDVVPDYAVSPAASIDAAGIGASAFPKELQLTAEQKAAIAALHDAFMKATAADVEALRALEREANAAKKAGKSREEVRAILAKATPILQRLDAAFKKLQADIWAVYTPEQRAWIEAHRPRACGPAALKLTDDQVKQIRALQEQFYEAVKPDLELIRSIAEEAKRARAAGKSRDEVAAILAKAVEPQHRVSDAEKKLQDAILALLTPEQRKLWACHHG